MSTFDELGIYSVASSFAAAAIIFQGIFSTIWAPMVYKWVAEGKDLEKVEQITEYVLAAIVLLFALAGVFSWIVPYFLPASYSRIQYILVACMGYPLFYTLSETTVVGIEIVRKTSYAMLASVIAVLVNVVANYLLVPRYGAAGAAISTATAFWIFMFLRTEFSCYLWRQIPRLKLYSLTLTCLLLSVLFALKGNMFHAYFIVAWAIVLVVALVLFKDIIKSSLYTIINMKFRTV
jgi:O-antigen/teichoic acid export membrane protein